MDLVTLTPPATPSRRHDELQRLSEACAERHGRESTKGLELKAEVKWLRENYIARQEFEDYQELVTTRYARVVKVVDGVVYCIIIAVVGALLALLIPALKH